MTDLRLLLAGSRAAGGDSAAVGRLGAPWLPLLRTRQRQGRVPAWSCGLVAYYVSSASRFWAAAFQPLGAAD